MALMPEWVVVPGILMIVLRWGIVVMAEIAVVLQEMQHHLWHAHPLMQIHGAEAIDAEGEGEEEAAH